MTRIFFIKVENTFLFDRETYWCQLKKQTIQILKGRWLFHLTPQSWKISKFFTVSSQRTTDRQRCCACNRESSKTCQFVSYSSLAIGVGVAFGIYFVLRCNPTEEEWCRFKNNQGGIEAHSEYATLILLVLLFTIGILFLFVRSVSDNVRETYDIPLFQTHGITSWKT